MKKATSQSRPQPTPRCKAILVCDQVESFPVELPPFFGYALLTDGIGACEVTIELQSLSDADFEIDWSKSA
jgi:hypothetical protein